MTIPPEEPDIYPIFPGVNYDYEFPPLVRQAMAGSTEIQAAITEKVSGASTDLVPIFKINTFYEAGQRILAPNGDIVTAKLTFTSNSEYNPVDWHSSAQDARLKAVEDKNTTQDLTITGLSSVYVPISRGQLATNTDLDTVRLVTQMGVWGLPSANTYTNKPSNMPSTTAVLEVFRDLGNNLALVQRITTATDIWWRKSSSSTVWSAWMQLETKASALATNDAKYLPLSRNVLATNTDLNTVTSASHIGTWGMPSGNTYPNKPAALAAAAVLEVQRDSGNNLTILQRITSSTDMWWREATTSGNWSAWVKAETVEHATLTFETLSGSALKLAEAKSYADAISGGSSSPEFVALEDRVENLEVMGGLEPGDVSDATIYGILANPATTTAKRVNETASLAGQANAGHHLTNPALGTADRAHTVTIPTYDGSGVAVHPSVYFNPARWNGWEYWMVMTPYPGQNNDLENPSIVVSRDGESWQVPAGLTNPLSVPSGDVQYLSDGYLTLANDGTMHCFWRAVTATHDRYYVRTSRNGVTWTPAVLVIQTDRTVYRHLSASFIQMADGTWTMYGVNIAIAPAKVIRLTAPSVTGPWSTPANVTFTGTTKVPWHIDVQRVGGEWHMLVMDTNGSGGDLWPAVSNDGLTFKTGPILLNRYPGEWDAYYYKSCFVPVIKDGLAGWDMWVGGALGNTNTPSIGRTFVSFSLVSPNHTHLDATTSVAGFMPASDKTKLNTSTDSSTNSALAQRNATGGINFNHVSLDAAPSTTSHATRKDYVDGLIKAVGIAPPVATMAPSEYPIGYSYATCSDASWPVQNGTLNTVRATAARSFQFYSVKGTGHVWTRAEGDTDTWGPFQRLSTDALATVTASGLMSSTDKANLNMTTSAYALNPSFDDWTGSIPAFHLASGTAPTKETTIFRRGPNAVRFNCIDVVTEHGLNWNGNINHAPNLEYFTVELEFYLVSGTSLSGAGVMLDWLGMTGSTRASLNLSVEIPTPQTGKWYRVVKVLRRPTSATGTWTGMDGFLMANHSSVSLGSRAVKDLIVDWMEIRPSTAEEISAYASKEKLDAATSAATPSTVVSRNSGGDSFFRRATAIDQPTQADQLTRRDYVDASLSLYAPSGAKGCTLDRRYLEVAPIAATVSGTMRLSAIWLPQGAVITNGIYLAGAAGSGITNRWFALFDSARNLLRTTADHSAAWAANATLSLPFATSYTVVTSGLFYFGICEVGTTPTSLRGTSSASTAMGLTPILNGDSGTGLTNAASTPSVSPAITAQAGIPFAYLT